LFLAEDGSSTLQTSPKLSSDGRALLRRFFLLAPRPRDPRELLVLHERTKPVVPTAWEANTLYYRIETDLVPSPSGELIICGTFLPGIEAPGRIESALRRLSHLCRRVSDVRFVIAFKSLPAAPERPAGLESKILFSLFENFGENAKAMDWQEFLGRSSYAGTQFIDLTSTQLIADSFLTHCLLSRGSAPLASAYQGLARRAGEGTRIRLSPYHGMRILGDAERVLEAWKEPSAYVKSSVLLGLSQ
jgi:hypothetical protein